MKRLLPVCLAFLFAGCGAKETEYKGQPLSYWIKAIDNHDPAVNTPASELLVQIGAKDKALIPALIRSMKKGSYSAAEVLGRIGPAGDDTRDVVPALIETIKTKGNGNFSLRVAAARAVAPFGDQARPAVPVLIDMLSDEDAEVRGEAAEILGKLPKSIARQAIPALKQVAQDDEAPNVQIKATKALEKIDPDSLKTPPPPKRN
jgi:hypothetical protein